MKFLFSSKPITYNLPPYLYPRENPCFLRLVLGNGGVKWLFWGKAAYARKAI